VSVEIHSPDELAVRTRRSSSTHLFGDPCIAIILGRIFIYTREPGEGRPDSAVDVWPLRIVRFRRKHPIGGRLGARLRGSCGCAEPSRNSPCITSPAGRVDAPTAGRLTIDSFKLIRLRGRAGGSNLGRSRLVGKVAGEGFWEPSSVDHQDGHSNSARLWIGGTHAQ
jgi:hypothetical protein